MIPDLVRGRVLVSVEVEVGVLSEKDSWVAFSMAACNYTVKGGEFLWSLTSLPLGRNGIHLDVPGVLAHRIGDGGIDTA